METGTGLPSGPMMRMTSVDCLEGVVVLMASSCFPSSVGAIISPPRQAKHGNCFLDVVLARPAFRLFPLDSITKSIATWLACKNPWLRACCNSKRFPNRNPGAVGLRPDRLPLLRLATGGFCMHVAVVLQLVALARFNSALGSVKLVTGHAAKDQHVFRSSCFDGSQRDR